MKTVYSIKIVGIQISLILVYFLSTLDCLSQDKIEVDFSPLSIGTNGSEISGIFFKANSENRVPTAILVQGFPGRDGDIKGIGSYLKKEGVNAYVFNYRGTWKSEGRFSIENAITDVIKTVEYLKLPDISKQYNIDTANIVLIGYSWGGGIIFLSAKSCPSVKKIISLGTTDLKIISDRLESDTTYKRANLNSLRTASESGIIRSDYMNAEEGQRWMMEHRDDLDLTKTVEALSGKKVLFIGGSKDNMVLIEKHIIPLYRLFQNVNPSNSRLIIFDSDHSFNNVLEDLNQSISDWIKNN